MFPLHKNSVRRIHPGGHPSESETNNRKFQIADRADGSILDVHMPKTGAEGLITRCVCVEYKGCAREDAAVAAGGQRSGYYGKDVYTMCMC